MYQHFIQPMKRGTFRPKEKQPSTWSIELSTHICMHPRLRLFFEVIHRQQHFIQPMERECSAPKYNQAHNWIEWPPYASCLLLLWFLFIVRRQARRGKSYMYMYMYTINTRYTVHVLYMYMLYVHVHVHVWVNVVGSNFYENNAFPFSDMSRLLKENTCTGASGSNCTILCYWMFAGRKIVECGMGIRLLTCTLFTLLTERIPLN